ncbi:MAG: hypothetical protein PF542_04320 [Nanoarchaeota archaeon]|jgi:hypothetical protein|nr:hypothetical protein [Nanoarchaeota archaeon]
MDKVKLLKEYETAFIALQKEYGFVTPISELEEIFMMRDHILETGYVRENFSAQVSSRIVDYFRNWAGYLNAILVPNPQSFVNQTESKLFSSEEDKQEMWKIVKICMRYSSGFSLMLLSRDKKMQAEFIDTAYNSWKNDVKPFMIDTMQRVHSAWNKE